MRTHDSLRFIDIAFKDLGLEDPFISHEIVQQPEPGQGHGHLFTAVCEESARQTCQI